MHIEHTARWGVVWSETFFFMSVTSFVFGLCCGMRHSSRAVRSDSASSSSSSQSCAGTPVTRSSWCTRSSAGARVATPGVLGTALSTAGSAGADARSGGRALTWLWGRTGDFKVEPEAGDCVGCAMAALSQGSGDGFAYMGAIDGSTLPLVEGAARCGWAGDAPEGTFVFEIDLGANCEGPVVPEFEAEETDRYGPSPVGWRLLATESRVSGRSICCTSNCTPGVTCPHGRSYYRAWGVGGLKPPRIFKIIIQFSD